MRGILIIGYSGHSYVALDILNHSGRTVVGYADREEKAFNPFSLQYLGPESGASAQAVLHTHDFFVAIGDNRTRARVQESLLAQGFACTEALRHPSASVGAMVRMGPGMLVAAQVAINPLASIGAGVICNTACVIEHECRIGNYAHIAPGAVLAGNVEVGEGAFIGANAVIKQGVRIGAWAVVGAGSVVLRDVPENAVVAGNPARDIGFSPKANNFIF